MPRQILRTVQALAAVLFSSILAQGADAPPTANAVAMTSHTFRYTPTAGAPTVPVSIAGDFNGWSAAPNPMTRGDDGTYSLTLSLPVGLHHYKIVYDGKWIADPQNTDKSLESDDGHDGKNSGFIAVAQVSSQEPSHTFIYAPPAGATTVAVSVVGDFNGWSATSNPMTRGDDGNYSATFNVPAGLHHCKIVYDGKWIADPTGDKALEADDGFKGKNGGFVADAAKAPEKSAIGGNDLTHTFRYEPPTGAATVPVSVAGDFNGWSAAPNPMVRGADGAYTATITVPAGLHHYKIVYDGKWIADPADDKSLESDDGFNGKNSGFVAGPTPH